MNRRLPYLLALLPQLLFLGYVVAKEELSFRRGETVLLEARPLGGVARAIVELSTPAGRQQRFVLSIATLSRALCRDGEDDPELGDTVYVILEKGTNTFAAAGYTSEHPDTDAIVFVRGRITGVNTDRINVSYDLPAIDVPAGALPADGRAEVTVEVRVRQSGVGVIERILVDGRSIADRQEQH